METKQLITFTNIYSSHKKPVYHYVVKMVRSTMTAEDIVQNVLFIIKHCFTFAPNNRSQKEILTAGLKNKWFSDKHYRGFV